MLKHLISFYGAPQPKPCSREPLSMQQRSLKRLQWSTSLSVTLGYGMYYACRLNLNVVKKSIVEEDIFSETELGIIGTVLFFTYAVGKFTNGFLADRSNISCFISTGLFMTALVNLFLGFVHPFILFAILWGINSRFQSMGAASCVAGLSRWFTDKGRGSFYGFWSASHSTGEAITFTIVASVVSAFGWHYGFLGTGPVGLVGVLVIWRSFHDSPQSKGLPAANIPRARKVMNTLETKEFDQAQKSILKNPAIWVLAFSSAFVYVSRYAVSSWGVFYLRMEKGYSTLDVSFIISVNSVCGIVGTIFSGIVPDEFFGGRRNIPALIFGLMNVMALCLLLLIPGVHFWLDTLSMMLFRLGIGVLICSLGDLMTVDVVPRAASGTALGMVGTASYIDAGLQDVMSGALIEGNEYVVNGVEVHDFTYISWFWIGVTLMSVLSVLLVWNARNRE